MSNGIGRVWAVNAEGGDEGRPNGVGPVWIENADQLGSKLPEPESGDAGKVLGVLNSDGDIGWVIDQSGTFTQVQADWDQTDSSQVSYIANKPSLATVATTGSYSDLSGTPTIPTVDQEYNSASANAQSGVAVAGAVSVKQDTISDLETIRSGAAAGATAVQPAALNDYATTSALTSGLSTKQDTINDLETIRSGASAGATAVQPSSLATVATTGSYTDLLDKPSIPAAQVNSDWTAESGVAQILNKPSLATVATTGSYADLSNKPTIPTVDQTYNSASANAQSGVAVASAVSVKQDTISDLETIRSGAAAGATAVQPGSLATVATTGSYDDLLDKPTIPPGVVVDQVYDASSTNAQSGTAVAGAISGVRQVPSTSSGDNGKVLGVTDSAGTLGWVTKGEVDLFYVTYNVTTFDEIKAAHDAGKWPVLVDSNGRLAPMVDFDWIGTAASIQHAQFQVSEYDYHSDAKGADYYSTVYTLELEIDEYLNRTETWSTTSNNLSADWNAVSGPRVIRNKPTIPAAQVNSDWNAASGVAQILNKPTLATVATSGAYADLSGTPSLATVATSGDYSDLLNKPSIPAAQVNSDWNASSGVSQILNKPSLATVATSGSYNDLSNKPTIPAAQVQSDWTEADTTDPSYIQNKPTVMGMVAGNNVTITEGASSVTIAATDTTYTAGTGIDITSGTISVDTTTVAMKTDIPSVPSAGNMLSVTNSVLNVTTTAGITDIQQVNALPAQPVATVLYLIPET